MYFTILIDTDHICFTSDSTNSRKFSMPRISVCIQHPSKIRKLF
nr:MAG TPA: hypothetical protein [Caudoviricetes sp.]